MTSCATSSTRRNQSEPGAGSVGVVFRRVFVIHPLHFRRPYFLQALPIIPRCPIYFLLKRSRIDSTRSLTYRHAVLRIYEKNCERKTCRCYCCCCCQSTENRCKSISHWRICGGRASPTRRNRRCHENALCESTPTQHRHCSQRSIRTVP